MVIGDDFIWLHKQKTGGLATRAFLRKQLKNVPGVSFNNPSLGKGMTGAHHSLRQRQKADPSFSYDGKTIICGIRRLPNWILSIVHFHVGIGNDQKLSRENLIRGEVLRGPNGGWLSADDRLLQFEPPIIDSWVRQENLTDDLFAAFQGLSVEKKITQTDGVPVKNSKKTSHTKLSLIHI